MTHVYNCKQNVKVMTTPNGDKIIVTNDAIFTSIICALYEAVEHQRADNRNSTAHATLELIDALDG